jgi:hypothetical protein
MAMCVQPSIPPLLGVLTGTNPSDRRLNSRDHLRNTLHSESNPGFATFSVSVTMPTPLPGAKTTSNVFRGVRLPNLFLKKLSTLRFAEDGGLPHGMPDSAT